MNDRDVGGSADVEFAIVGGGLLGLAAARSLSRRGHEVLLFERDVVGNERAGSKGSARVFRLGYDDPFYVSMARAAEPMWRELEAETGRELLSNIGQLSFGEDLDLLRAAMAAAGAPFEDLDMAETRKRAPALETGSAALFEPASGVLAADRCLAAIRQSGLAAGAEVREGTRVEAVSDDGGRVRLVTANGTVTASVAVVCAGHWTSELLSRTGIGLRLVPTLEQIVYLSPITGRQGAASIPVFIERASPWVYGLPSGNPGLLKVALHCAGPIAHPDESPLIPDASLLSRLADNCARLLPSHHVEPVSTERCFYDASPDEDFVVDRVGRVVIGAGTSGHGFKFGPLLGELLADLATGGSPQVDLERFSARRPAVAA